MKTGPDLRNREVAYGSDAYRACVQLRYSVLREPLELVFSAEQLAKESGDYHLASYKNAELAACLVLTPAPDGGIIMRQVAVALNFQRQGIGRILVEFAENLAREHGFSSMLLHARETAVPFYEAQGYRCVGSCFEEITLPHWEMWKEL